MGRYTATAALAVLVGLGVTACSSSDDSSGDRSVLGGDEQSAPTEIAPESGEVDHEAASDSSRNAAVAEGELATAGSQAPSAPIDLDGYGRALAVEAGVTIGTSDIRSSVDDTLMVVRRNNGIVYSADVNIGDELDDGSIDGSGRIVVKVPPTDLDALIADLDGTAGVMLGRTQNSEDVTEQLIDLDIRIRVEETTIEGFETLLDQATEFNDIVTIQGVISEHTIVLEQLLATQRNVEQRVDLSTLTVDLTYVAPADIDEPVASDADGDDGIADAFRTGWDTFVGVLFAIGLVLAIAAPFVGVAALLLGVVWLIGRRRRPARRSMDAPSPAVEERVDDDQLVGPSPQA